MARIYHAIILISQYIKGEGEEGKNYIKVTKSGEIIVVLYLLIVSLGLHLKTSQYVMGRYKAQIVAMIRNAGLRVPTMLLKRCD